MSAGSHGHCSLFKRACWIKGTFKGNPDGPPYQTSFKKAQD